MGELPQLDGAEGDEAVARRLEDHRVALTGHCYRMLGSAAEADDAVQETATLSMPPYALWLRGLESIDAWLRGPGAPCRGSRLLRTSACGSPAFAQYRTSGPAGRPEAWALIVLELEGDLIAGITSFLDVRTIFPRFGFPLVLEG